MMDVNRKWRFPLIASTIVFLLLLSIAALSLKPSSGSYFRLLQNEGQAIDYADQNYSKITSEQHQEDLLNLLPPPPRLAYLISGNKGDGMRMRRLLQALYHPHNKYVLHLDLAANASEKIDLAQYVRNEQLYHKFGNVDVIGKGNLVTYRGPTMVSTTLHGAAMLLKNHKDWDWFINLSASDYPLVTQDDILHVFSFLPRDLNFIEHTSELGWKENARAKPIIVDPALYAIKKGEIFYVTQKRPLPTAFRLFTGSAWAALSQSFMEYTIMGWDNLPRQLLMYYSNFVSSPEGYFHTVLCNSEFRNTTVNHDLHYIAWDNPPKQHPLALTTKDFDKMVRSRAPFARKFPRDDPVLDMIDTELLNRTSGWFTPGAWCLGTQVGEDPCAVSGDPTMLKPGLGAQRLEELVTKLLANSTFRQQQCVFK